MIIGIPRCHILSNDRYRIQTMLEKYSRSLAKAMRVMYVCMYVCTYNWYIQLLCATRLLGTRKFYFFISCSPPVAGYWYQLSRRKERWGSRRGTHLYPLGTIPAPKISKLSMALVIRWGSSIGNTRKRQNDQSNRRYFVPFCLYTSKATAAPKLKRE